MDSRAEKSIIALRLVAVAAMILVVWMLWQVMLILPWPVDCLIAGAAALAFAYRFERGQDDGPSLN